MLFGHCFSSCPFSIVFFFTANIFFSSCHLCSGVPASPYLEYRRAVKEEMLVLSALIGEIIAKGGVKGSLQSLLNFCMNCKNMNPINLQKERKVM